MLEIISLTVTPDSNGLLTHNDLITLDLISNAKSSDDVARSNQTIHYLNGYIDIAFDFFVTWIELSS